MGMKGVCVGGGGVGGEGDRVIKIDDAVHEMMCSGVCGYPLPGQGRTDSNQAYRATWDLGRTGGVSGS
jgi:hypothetical protein